MNTTDRLAQALQAVRSRVSHWGWAEFSTLAALGLASGALFAFVEIAGDVIEGDTRALDERLLMALLTPNDLGNPIGPLWLEQMFTDLTSLGSHTTLTVITLAVIGFLVLDGKSKAALLVLVSVAGGALISHFSKLGFARPRPELVGHLVDVQTLSFPSGHAMLSAVTYLTLGALLTRTKTRARTRFYFIGLAVLLTLLVGSSRVYLGVHYPSDVLAGWCLGAAWALACWAAALWLQNRGQVETPRETQQ